MRRLSAIMMVVCAALVSAASAQEPEAGKAVQGLKLTLFADKDELKMTPVEGPDGKVTGYVVEPTRLSLTFVNAGRARLKLIAHNLDWELVRFEVKGPDADSVVAARGMIERAAPEPRESDFPSLDPSRAWTARWRPNFPGRLGPVQFKLMKPGEYRVKAVYACDESKLRLSEHAEGAWTGTLASNWLVLKCALPGAAAETKPETAPGEEAKPDAEAKPAEVGLKVLLEADRKEIRLKAVAGAGGAITYEPVEPANLTISLQNAGEKPLKLYTHGLGMRLVTLNVTGPDAQSVRAEKALPVEELPRPAEADFPTIDPLSAWTLEGQARFPGPFGGMRYTLLKPGEYRVSVTYTVDPADLKRTPLATGCWTGTVTSEEIVLKCVVADGE